MSRTQKKTRSAFGATAPPFLDYLKDILRRYPDGGQILKELIQNADDAGASRVVFIHDDRSYGRRSLWSDDLGTYQGPALYAFNNAVFTEKDWKGIQLSGRSVKRDDPNKVGRFGIGFNSVYHITDVPCIFSSKYLGFMDPQEKLFGERLGGILWSLDDEEDKETLTDLQDQFQPFQDIVDLVSDQRWEEVIRKDQHFDGTLFRFPLRNKASEISDNLYDSDKVGQLFDSFIADADISTLFLRNVSAVSLMHINIDGSVNVRLQVTSSSPSPDLDLESREESTTEGSTCFKVISSISKDHVETKTRWLVTTCCMKEGNVPELDLLAKKLCFRPQVDLAFPCGQENVSTDGRLSCFLPLPNNESNKTGLPVHVNACFGLTDNRRHIKWQEEDQKHDEAAKWNELLVKEVLPHSYLKILQDSINLSKSSALPVSTVYRLWPDVTQTKHKEKWHGIALDVLQRLFEQNIAVFSLAEDGRMFVSPSEAVCPSNDTESLEAMAAVKKALIAGGEKLITLPDHVSEAIQQAFEEPDTLKWVTPAFVRNVLRRGAVSSLSKEDKLCLLEYILSDENYHDLSGIHLLPLSDGTFKSFTNKNEDIALIDNDAFPRDLLPGSKNQFIPDDLSTACVRHLKKLAATNTFKVFNVDAKIVVAFAKKNLPRDWEGTDGPVTWKMGSEQHPPLRWLPEFWKFLNTHWGELSYFNGMPLIPIEPLQNGQSSILLARLQQKSTLVFRKSMQATLPDKVERVVRKVGGTVVNRDECLKHKDLDLYVLPPSPKSILQVFMNVQAHQVIDGIKSASHPEKEELKNYLSTLDSLTAHERDLLSDLPLFRLMGGEYVAARSKQAVVVSVVPAIPAELPMPNSVVQCSDEADRRLLLLLKIDLLDTAKAAIHLIDGVERRSFRKEEMERIMAWILQHGSILFSQNETLFRRCKDLSFFEMESGERKKTSSLFDPRSETFKTLFETDFFPPPVYTQTPQMFQSLTCLGMQTKEIDITSDNVLHVATDVQKLHVHSKKKALKKAEALVKLLNNNDLLSKFSKQKLQHLSQLQWIPSLNSSAMRKCLNKPQDIRHNRYLDIVGHVMPLTGELSEKVSKTLGLLRRPPAEKVIKNLLVLKSMAQGMSDPDENGQFKRQLHSTYKFMQDHFSEFKEIMKKQCIPWIWIHNHFVSPSDVVLAYPPDLDLNSYIGRVPEEFLPYKKLLTEFGVKTSLSEEEIKDILHDIQQTIEERQEPLGNPSELKVSLAILNWMWKEKKTFRDDIPVPVMAGSQRFTLQPLSKTVFCDIGRDGLEDLKNDQEEFHVIHEEIPRVTAEWLKIPLLSTRILCPEFIGIEQCGQSEPITLRIKNILKEYDEENDIFKELIQNAEDAGANTCKFVVDFRRHTDPPDSLIDPGMTLCQGPCLWAFNNELFTQDDWINIVKVGSASKENRVEKIGKFGLGFNSVYHVTDIPSILSGEGLLILDPNVTHLEKHIQSKGNPGIKLDLSRQQLFNRFPGQFRPYERIFDCNLSRGSTQKFYPGTLIKLPFRTQEEALKSEISRKVYGKDDIITFQQDFTKNSQTHLLFLKNIDTVSLQNLTDDASTPPEDHHVVTLFTASRKVANTIKIPKDSFFHAMQSDALKTLMKLDPKCKEVIDCHTINITEVTQQHCDGPDVQFWLLYNCFGTQQSLLMAQTENKQTAFSLPIGGVAVPLHKESQTGKWVIKETKLVGQAFCFLPLAIDTGLPVNVNGSFAVTSNRRGLWQSGLKSDWNRALLQDAVTTAYVTALLVLKTFSKKGQLNNYHYFTCWPNTEKVSKSFKPLVDAFYSAIVQPISGKQLELLSDGENWYSMDTARFLHPSIENDKAVGELAKRVCRQSNSNTPYHVVPLPLWVRDSFHKAGFDEALQKRTLNWIDFYREVVFNNLNTMDPKSRNALVLHAIDLNDNDIDNLLRTHRCIPTQTGGQQLQFIKRLVNPSGKVACLFEQKEGRFLEETTNGFCSPRRIQRLSELGMLNDHLPLQDITERVETIGHLWLKNKGKAYKHIQCILELMRDSLKDKDSPYWETLRNTAFIPACLPVITCKKRNEKVMLQRPIDIYSDNCRHLVSMTQSVVDHSNLKIHCDDPVLRMLGVQESPQLKTVLQQLQEAYKHSETCNKQELSNVATECYSFLNDLLHYQEESSRKFISERAHSFPFLLVEGKFVDLESVAKNKEFDVKPYLHVLPYAFHGFNEVWECVGINEQFTSEQFFAVLQKLSNAYGSRPLSNFDLNICLTIIQRGLFEAKSGKEDDCLIPDESGVLQPASRLHFNDTPWMEVSDVHLCHKYIPRVMARHFGVKTTRHHTLQNHLVETFSPFAKEFGQREKLTVRIKNIIAAYPSKKDILKELIQNADDAEATEIHFVWDKRQHRTEKTFGKRWNPLQGPALCVYNNKVFSDADLTGIQQLGEGGKHNIPGKTGKYGLGFNSVYHLTDCPAILTGDKWLCISDPNLKYVENGPRKSPGCKYSLEEQFKKSFIDVYQTFLPETFNLKEGTMFRLPIRMGTMANSSEISKQCVTDNDMTELSTALSEDPEGLILFLRNIRKIQFHEINSDTKMPIMTFSIEKRLPEQSILDNASFQNYVQNSLLSDSPITPLKTIYNVEISSSNKRPSKWIIAEQFGSFKRNTDVERKHSDKVPQAALAACVGSKTGMEDLTGRAFCSLPLPVKTGLPIHVNGNFEVDSSRRDLWKEDGKSLKTDWNESLKLNIIAPLYADLLNDIHCNLKKVKVLSIHCVESGLENSYFCFFPCVSKDVGPDWHEMIHEVYRSVSEKELSVIPVIQSSSRQVATRSFQEYTVDWSSVSKREPNDAPHLITQDSPTVIPILEDLGMKLVPSSRKMEEIWKSFKTAGVGVRTVNPVTVRDYLRRKPLHDATQTEMGLPLPIGQTLIRDKSRCSKLLDYCLKDVTKDNSSSVSGLPLLLTQDQILRKFNHNSPKFLSEFQQLFHGNEEEFADYTTNYMCDVLRDGNFIRELTIPAAVQYLKPTLGLLLQNCEIDPHSRLHVPDETILTWLKELWEFFGKTFLVDGDLSVIAELFSDCPILPVVCQRQNKKPLLQIMGKMSSVIQFSTEKLSPILLKLGLLNVHFSFFQNIDPLMHHHLHPRLLNTSDSSAVLDQVSQLSHSEFQLLSNDELNELQCFLQSGITSSKNKQEYQRKLKSLPIFETIQGIRQRIDGHRNVFILNTELMGRFPDLYTVEVNSTFLKCNPENKRLSENVDIRILSDLDYYVQFILPVIHNLTESQRLLSVQLLLSLQRYDTYQTHHSNIISTMSNVKLICNIHGDLQMASYFFDKSVKLYKIMLPQDRFVPESFWNIFGFQKSFAKELLRELGMKHAVSDEEIIEFAQQIELDAKGTVVALEELKLKSSTLFETVLNKPTKNQAPHILTRIAHIKFLFPVEIQQKLRNYHQTFAAGRSAVAIKGSLIEREPLHQHLIWTSMPILHLPNCTSGNIQKMKDAGAVEQPPPECITENLKNICQSPNCQTVDDLNLISTRAEVLRHSYAHLQTMDFDAGPLTDLPVVLVEKDRQLVKAKQTVLVLSNNLEFRPYLYEIQSKDAIHKEFFTKVGVKERPTAKQYCNVLKDIHEDATDKHTLNPNQQATVKRAVEQLFHLINDLQAEKMTPEFPKALYLPSTDGRLYMSNTLYFDDTVFQVRGLGESLENKLQLLVKLNNCHLGTDMYEHQRLLQLLPPELQPKMLSQKIIEHVVESNMQPCEYGNGCEFSGWFEEHLSSAAFTYGLVCLIREQFEGKMSQDDATNMCQETFGSIKITCCKSLETVLLLGQEQLSDTIAAAQVYIKKGQQGCTFYLRHNDDMAFKVMTDVNMRLTKEINALLGNKLGSNLLLVLGRLLSCDDLQEVKKTLEENGIHDSASTDDSQHGPPPPGSLIPEEWQDSLDMNFLNNFEEGECVGYKEPSKDDLCFAVIVEQLCVPSGQTGQYSCKYKIQIGKDEVIEVSGLDLYQFKREKKPFSSKQTTCMELELSESAAHTSPTRVLPKSLEEIKKEIDKCLTEIWALPEEERCKALRRLYLRWHPDKNPDCIELATEAFKYLQNRIEELEKGKTGQNSRPQWNTNFSGFYQQWNQEANRHRRGRERFYRSHNSYRGRYNFWTHHGNVPQPNRAEAQRWLRQAQCDLTAAHNDTGGNSTEWCLFKVHQAVEKALMAAEYKRRGQHSTNSSLSSLAEQVSHFSPQLSTVPSMVGRLKLMGVDAKKTQYPNYHPSPRIPNGEFKSVDEAQVLNMASELLCKVEAYVN